MSCNTAFSEWYWGVTTGAITGVLIPWYMEQSCYKGIEYGALACSITATVALTRLTSSQKNYRNNCLDAMGLDCVTGLLGGTIRSFLQAKRRGVSLPWACFFSAEETLSRLVIWYIGFRGACIFFDIKREKEE